MGHGIIYFLYFFVEFTMELILVWCFLLWNVIANSISLIDIVPLRFYISSYSFGRPFDFFIVSNCLSVIIQVFIIVYLLYLLIYMSNCYFNFCLTPLLEYALFEYKNNQSYSTLH